MLLKKFVTDVQVAMGQMLRNRIVNSILSRFFIIAKFRTVISLQFASRENQLQYPTITILSKADA